MLTTLAMLIRITKTASTMHCHAGGVGSFAAEFLCRAGVGFMTIVDGDTVDITNKNRQLPALNSTIGHHKCDVMAQRLMDINPKLNLTVLQVRGMLLLFGCQLLLLG